MVIKRNFLALTWILQCYENIIKLNDQIIIY